MKCKQRRPSPTPLAQDRAIGNLSPLLADLAGSKDAQRLRERDHLRILQPCPVVGSGPPLFSRSLATTKRLPGFYTSLEADWREMNTYTRTLVP
ncbi:MAG: hypothetical protein H8D43_01680 [Chloroflexi bacterium]|nr:hypothetical protein [Chloroflexota bacterium]